MGDDEPASLSVIDLWKLCGVMPVNEKEGKKWRAYCNLNPGDELDLGLYENWGHAAVAHDVTRLKVAWEAGDKTYKAVPQAELNFPVDYYVNGGGDLYQTLINDTAFSDWGTQIKKKGIAGVIYKQIMDGDEKRRLEKLRPGKAARDDKLDDDSRPPLVIEKKRKEPKETKPSSTAKDAEKKDKQPRQQEEQQKQPQAVQGNNLAAEVANLAPEMQQAISRLLSDPDAFNKIMQSQGLSQPSAADQVSLETKPQHNGNGSSQREQKTPVPAQQQQVPPSSELSSEDKPILKRKSSAASDKQGSSPKKKEKKAKSSKKDSSKKPSKSSSKANAPSPAQDQQKCDKKEPLAPEQEARRIAAIVRFQLQMKKSQKLDFSSMLKAPAFFSQPIEYRDASSGQVLSRGRFSQHGSTIFCGCKNCRGVIKVNHIVFEIHASGSGSPGANTYLSQSNVSLAKLLSVLNSDENLDDVDVHIDYCYECKKGGDLLCCETCTAAYHVECVGLDEVPEGDWFCPICVAAANSSVRK